MEYISPELKRKSKILAKYVADIKKISFRQYDFLFNAIDVFDKHLTHSERKTSKKRNIYLIGTSNVGSFVRKYNIFHIRKYEMKRQLFVLFK